MPPREIGSAPPRNTHVAPQPQQKAKNVQGSAPSDPAATFRTDTCSTPAMTSRFWRPVRPPGLAQPAPARTAPRQFALESLGDPCSYLIEDRDRSQHSPFAKARLALPVLQQEESDLTVDEAGRGGRGRRRVAAVRPERRGGVEGVCVGWVRGEAREGEEDGERARAARRGGHGREGREGEGRRQPARQRWLLYKTVAVAGRSGEKDDAAA